MAKSVSILSFTLALLLLSSGMQSQTATSGPTPVKEYSEVSGWPLQYKDLVEGTGATAEPGMRISVHYTGWLLNGTKFDSSGKNPYKFVLGSGKVIRGWDIGIEGMKVGGKRQLRIPDSMAYGMAGSPPKIPPSATLIFEVELVSADRKNK